MAVEEINAAGGVLGREIELFVPDVDKLSPESCRQAIAACIDKKVHAISNAFLFAPIPAMDESAKYKCPYLAGQHSAECDARLQGRPKEVQPRAPDRSVGGQLRLDLSAVADQDGGDWRLETQEPEDPHRRRAGRLLPDNPQGSAGVDPEIQFRARCCDRHPIPGQRLEPGDPESSRKSMPAQS